MKGDFTRDTFSPLHRFTRVLTQQGRVQLDADANEQAAILLHFLRSLAADVIGPHGGPANNLGFAITPAGKNDFTLSPGHYYVDGLLCENEADLNYSQQTDLPNPTVLDVPQTGRHNYLVYLDVWEQHVTYLQDPTLREPALNGPDTATRARLVFQVRVTPSLLEADGKLTPIPETLPAATDWKKWLFEPKNQPNRWNRFVGLLQSENRGLLKAQAQPDTHSDPELCLASPGAGYRGVENQLYRVEIQRPGTAWDKTDAGRAGAATFKWSRENGTVVFPIYQLEGDLALIERPLDDRLGLHVAEWVEITGDVEELSGSPSVLAEVIAVQPAADPTRLQVRLRPPDGVKLVKIGPEDQPNHPLLRRWDHRTIRENLDPGEIKQLLIDTGGAVLVQEGIWLDLERGVRIYFNPAPAGATHTYRHGDYWLIPARTAIENVLWPGVPGSPQALPPHGVEHHYAPLAVFPAMAGVKPSDVVSLQRSFQSLPDLP
jgi:hypothetical protein